MQGTIQHWLARWDIVVERWPTEGSLERELRRVLTDRAVTTVIDVGAHEGRFGSTLRRIGFAGQIVGLEPSPGPFQRLAALSDGNRLALQVAVGDAEGTAELHEYHQHEEFTSLRRPSQYGTEEYGLTIKRTIEVSVRRLDDIVHELGIDSRRSMIKVDTQGHDLAVLEGGAETVAVAAALQVEIPMFGLYEGSPTGPEMINRVLDLGFDLIGMFPVHEHPRPLVPVEFDALFARGGRVG